MDRYAPLALAGSGVRKEHEKSGEVRGTWPGCQKTINVFSNRMNRTEGGGPGINTKMPLSTLNPVGLFGRQIRVEGIGTYRFLSLRFAFSTVKSVSAYIFPHVRLVPLVRPLGPR